MGEYSYTGTLKKIKQDYSCNILQKECGQKPLDHREPSGSSLNPGIDISETSGNHVIRTRLLNIKIPYYAHDLFTCKTG